MKENLTLRLRIKLKDGKLADKVDLNLVRDHEPGAISISKFMVKGRRGM
jgi:hypothetical protein